MKNLVLFAILMALAAYVSSTVLQIEKEVGTPEVIESFKEIDGDLTIPSYNSSNVIDTKGSIHLYKGSFVTESNANVISVIVAAVRFSTNIRISSVSARADESASARITEGGVGSNNVTLRMQSKRSRGFNITVDIYGNIV